MQKVVVFSRHRRPIALVAHARPRPGKRRLITIQFGKEAAPGHLILGHIPLEELRQL